MAYLIGGRLMDAVRDVSFEIFPGQVYGLVGESGSGKTTLAMAILGYLGEAGVIRQGRIELAGINLLALDTAEMRKIWGKQIAFVPQNPLASLNPSLRIGEQVAEVLRTHLGMDPATARRETIGHLKRVKLPDPQRVAESYPHQISGGMQQRVLIAMALCTEPELLLLDEPTTNLDVTTQAAIIELFRDLIRGRQTAVLYVTHNLGVVAQLCDRVAVLYAGELVENTRLDDLFAEPLHPYTIGLLNSIPRLGETKSNQVLPGIPGQIPMLGDRPTGCIFITRCAYVQDICQQRPDISIIQPDRTVRCHRWKEIPGIADQRSPLQANPPQEIPALQAATPGIDQPSLLSIHDLQVHFLLSRSLRQALHREPPRRVRAVDGISLELAAGKTLGLVGESGSGKSTLARAVVGLLEPTAGKVELLGFTLPASLSRRDLATMRRLQMIFQEPDEALNPYRTIGATLARPLIRLLNVPRQELPSRINRLLEAVRLPAAYADRLPGQLSGGEKQRVAIARAFAARPDLLIADEAVSALDVSVQASILNLLKELQGQLNTAMIFISHDLAVVSYLADTIAVAYLGQIMQISPSDQLVEPPYHPYTEVLLSCIPEPTLMRRIDVAQPPLASQHVHLEGEIPTPIDKPDGCPFHPRCPRSLGDLCSTQQPPWQETMDGKMIFCHIPVNELRDIQSPGGKE